MPIVSGRKMLVPAGIQTLLRDLVHERSGALFEEDRLESLMEKLEALAEDRGCESMLDYYYMLKHEENGAEDWSRVMDALSVQETYLWREMAQVRTLVSHFVPSWFKRSSAPLRIWSAACATGEEAYSILISLLEAGFGSHPIEINATDASGVALAKAREATFREKAFRTFPAALKEKYFLPYGNLWKLRPELAQRVSFSQANLMAPEEISGFARSPVIFCRNVFIYFSAHAIRKTVATFASRMPAGGHLYVGASESLLKLTADFELREIGDSFVYVRI